MGRATPDETAHAAQSTYRCTQENSPCVGPKCVRILNWNVEGLFSKLGEAEFTQYVSSLDIICFTESFLAFQSALNCVADFAQFSRPAVKLSDQGKSGGVLISVKRTLENFVEIIDRTPDKIVLLKLDKTVFFLFFFHMISMLFCVGHMYDHQAHPTTNSPKVQLHQVYLL